MTVRLSALSAGHPLHSERFMVIISIRHRVDPRVIVRLEEQLRHYATCRNVAGSIFNEVTAFFN
jgi:hypothetical protein